MKYNCKTCDFHTNEPARWQRHIGTNKHKNGHEKKDQRERYSCDTCYFYTDSKQRLNQHLLTNKHFQNEEFVNKFKKMNGLSDQRSDNHECCQITYIISIQVRYRVRISISLGYKLIKSGFLIT